MKATRTIVFCCFLVGCNAYDTGVLQHERSARDAGPGSGSSSDLDAAADAGSMVTGSAGSGGSTAGSGGGGSAGSNSPLPDAGCKPNPNELDQVCTVICPEVCDGQDNDCDRRIDEDATLCAAAHSKELCSKGECVVSTCLDGYRDCDGLAANGCEVSPSDPEHCGLCTHVCSIANATAMCVDGECKVAKCAAGRGDCDQDGKSCETSLDTLTDCGGCASTGDNEACLSLPNATTQCTKGVCAVASCIGNFGDCDKDGKSCETELNQQNHCGGCTQTCSLPGTNASCATGNCLATTCSSGFDECSGGPGNGCESLSTAENCGGCGKHCGPDPDPSVDNHVVTASCSSETCSISKCAAGYANCDGNPFNGCETGTKTEQNCGGCGVTCDGSAFPNANVSCASGSCSFIDCKDGWGDCTGGTADGCETKLDVVAHCGSCGHACTGGQFCTGGKCSDLDCSSAPHASDCGGTKCADCNGDGIDCERDVSHDLANCQACGNLCAFNAGPAPVGTLVCTTSGCGVACPPNYADCDGDYRNGCEKSLLTLSNCGSCGMGCSIPNATATCASGACRVQQCATDYADCNADGLSCETSLAAPSSCGSCNTICSAANALPACGGTPGNRSCSVGTCSQSYYRDCDGLAPDGCEVDTRSDAGNCGACANDCTTLPNVATASCNTGACSVGSCDPGWGDCNLLPGCETQVNTTAQCGSCNNDCSLALAHTAAASCDASTLTCKITTCAAGYASCDGSDANGCETDLHTVNDCGGCSSTSMNSVCSGLPNVASSTCGSGACVIQTCSAGFLDCDQIVSNGCERDGSTLGPCAPDANCTQKSFGGHTYYFCQNDSSWSAARSKCKLQLGGELAEITGGAEASFVQGNLSANAWIGANDSDVEGQFEWSADGVPFWKNGVSVLGGYANWNSGEPSASTSADDCVEVIAGATNPGKWNDTTCATAKDFVCEVVADACPSDASKWLPGQCGCGVADTDADADGFAACNDACDNDPNKLSEGLCGCGVSESACGPGADCVYKSYAGMSSTGYYFCTHTRSWDSARGLCQTLQGANLAHIDDATEDNFVKANVTSMTWIGGSDAAVEGQWRWVDDGSLFWSGNGSGTAQGGHYVHWSTVAAQPEGGTGANCGAWWGGNNGWADEACATAYPFVCEVPADSCPSSPKLAPGQCGCALADTDSDLDGVADCNDECPNDPELSVAGDCGCPSAPVADGTACNDGPCSASMQCKSGRCGDITQCFTDSPNISVGYYHACSRSDAGKAYCWGYDGNGRLGDGGTLERRGPIEVPGLSDVREIAAGESHTCAIVGGGDLYCWGNGATSRLGTGNVNDQHSPTKIAGITTAVQLSIGTDHSCVVLANGTVQCWGNGAGGRLGDNSVANNATPGPVSNLSDAVQVACGSDFTCARRSGGTVSCWGNGANGRLGNNATGTQMLPVAVQNLSNVVQITAGGAHACAIVAGGQAYCWGYGANGRLGNNSVADQLVPVAVTGLGNAVQIEAGDTFTCAVRSNQAAVCWGYNANGRLGTGDTTEYHVPTTVAGSFAYSRISAGFNSTCARSSDGAVHCFGYGVYGINGDGANADRQSPNTVSLRFRDAQAVSTGYAHSCGIDAGNVLRCFGDDTYSQLGDGAVAARWTPIPPTTLANVMQVSTGEWQTCALTTTGDVYCWGINTNGRLGLGDTTTRTTPTKVALGGVAIQVSTAYDTSCAVMTGGAIKCWGLDDSGQLGDGGLNVSFTAPVNVFGISNAVEVRAAYRHTCARLSDGTLRCWGYNGYGQLGDNTIVSEGVPVAVMGVSGATSLAVSMNDSCAVVSGGQVKCWGQNDLGQIGDGTNTDRHVATTVSGLSDAVEISTFYKHVCVTRQSGTIACWGYNANGRLGSGDANNSLVPIGVVGITDAQHIAAGYNHTCTTLRSGAMRCWGYGTQGQLGHGNSEDRLTPSPVQGLLVP